MLLQRLELGLSGKQGDISVDAKSLNAVLEHVKRLEQLLADALGLAYARRERPLDA